MDKAIEPLAGERPEWGARMVKGAWWRAALNLQFFAAAHGRARRGRRRRPDPAAERLRALACRQHDEHGDGTHQVTSEVGRLRTVLLHRPGAELSRLTPRNNADLLFDGAAVGRPGAGGARRLRRGAARARGRGALPDRPARRGARGAGGPRRRHRLRRRAGASSGRCSPTSCAVAERPAEPRAGAGAVGGPHPRRAAGPRRRRRRRPARRARRVRRAPAAQPAVHARLVGLGRRPRRRHQPVDARPRPGAHLHRGRSTSTPRASPAPRCSTAATREEAWFEGGDVLVMAPGRGGRRHGAAHDARRAWRPSRCARSPRASRTRCSPSRSRRSGRRCTSTPSARWSTATPW